MHSLRKELTGILRDDSFRDRIAGLSSYPDQLLVRKLLPFLCRDDDIVKWRAVTAIGMVTHRLCRSSLEDGRVVLRQLVWNLSEESGGIGWGCPEAMGEIMAVNRTLADEFHHILVSFILPGENFLDFGPLLSGAMWGTGRLAQVRPELIAPAIETVIPLATSPDRDLRARAQWVLSSVDRNALDEAVRVTRGGQQGVLVYIDGKMVSMTV